MRPRLICAVALFLCVEILWADGPSDNVPEKVRRVPPLGVKIGDAERADLDRETKLLAGEIDTLRDRLKTKPALAELLPDVEIFHKAVRWALDYDEFYGTNEVREARELLDIGHARAAQLREGNPGWLAQTGLVVRGYRSRIDGSVQPYGMVVPGGFRPDGPARRLDFWFHGRGEKMTELDFIYGRLRSPGDFTPRDAFVMHLYGRYCNGSKFAGETDFFEALEHARKFYPVDENRMVVRGFSLGGASCWHFAAHFAGLWAAAAPGAGFAETAEFLRVYQNEPVAPPWYEQKLWRMYDATDYAANLFNCPTVAYSGEVDTQKQAGDIMAKALAEEGMTMTHIIGPKTGHGYHPAAKLEINRRIDSIVARGRNQIPDRIRFTTFTLRYNRMLWTRVDRLEKHWERARVEADLDRDGQTVQAVTTNVGALSFVMESGLCPFDITRPPHVILDGQTLEASPVETDRSWNASFRKIDGRWALLGTNTPAVLEKRHGLQGPIDDAFMDSFVMVSPTGEPMTQKTGDWAASEMKHAVDQWRSQYRGNARVLKDEDVSDEVVAANNLVLWGDPKSNKVLAKILGRLPLQWDDQQIALGTKTFAAGHHMPVLIFPNPLNPDRYVVLNSGFTFREYDYLNNARQVSKLPDYAVIDVDSPVTTRYPGAVAEAGFFGEKWEIIPAP
jgi:dienelactone hydrolase